VGGPVNVAAKYPHVERADVYARDVVAGKLPACRWVRLACQRQIDDRERKDWQFRFDKDRAEHVCKFLELLPHVKGRWKSKNIELEDWQCFQFTTIFGWVDVDGHRRFRTAYTEVPRKNAKTTCSAGVGLYMLSADGESGAEVYSTAVTRDQARISFDIAARMAAKTSGLRDRFGVEVQTHNLYVPSTGSVFRPLASDADSLDGLNIHCAIVDELHAHKSRKVFDAIDTATGSRRQALKWIITTAGSDKNGVCYEQRKYVTEVLLGHVHDERYWGIVYSIDPEDDWTTVEAQRKANPNYGVSVLPDDIATGCGQALVNPQTQNNFKTKRLNVWVSVGTSYFNALSWEQLCKQPIVEADYEGCPCWFALDLASKWDVAAFMRLYERGPGQWAIFGSYYLPEDSVAPGMPNYEFYSEWAKAGFLTLTPGQITDYDFIERDLLEWNQRALPAEVCYDPYQATQLATRMGSEGLLMVEIPMTVKQMSEPMKALGAAIIGGDIWHDGDPVMSWMVANVMGHEDVKENVYPRKETRNAKIDGAVATIMALSRASLSSGTSIYADAATAI